jgi:mono/diheme cytochrome c family protein
MAKRHYIIAATLVAVAGGGVLSAYADWDEQGEHHGFAPMRVSSSQKSGAAMDPTYQQECGSCHTAFPPSFLPTRSWNAIMDGLTKHFGDNAELAADQAAAIRTYLQGAAADGPNRAGRGDRVMAGIKAGDTPLRVTETSYFQRLHREVPKDIFTRAPQIKSFANCQGCHPRADKGIFDEDEVRIPGAKNWEQDD